jgi:hypothetical protein
MCCRLDQAENPKPGIWVVWFDLVFTWSEADAVERPLLDLFVGWDVIPSFEIFVAVDGHPVAPEDSTLVSVDVTSAGDGAFGCVLEVALCLELLLTFLLVEGFVPEGGSDFLSDGMKHVNRSPMSVIEIEMSTRIRITGSSSHTSVR